MSNEFYIQGYKNGEPDGAEISEVLQSFGRVPEDEHDGLYQLKYDELNECEINILVENNLATSVCIFRPCGHANLYQGVFSLLQKGRYVLFASDGDALVVAHPGVTEHLPEDMVDSLGEPVVVSEAASILSILYGE